MPQGGNIQDLRRAIVSPTYTGDAQTQLGVLARSYSQLAQEVVQVHNRIFSIQVPVAGGISSLQVILPAPDEDNDDSYSPVVILDWAAYAHLTAITGTDFTLAFSAASPGGGGTVRIIVIS